MGETLFISHRIPFPPDRGDKIRSHHLLKALARMGPVHVATMAETDADFAAAPLLAEIAASYRLAPRRRNLAVAGLRALVSGRPVSLAAFDNADLRRWVKETLATRPIEAIFVFSGQMGQYVPSDFAGRLVVDLCDVDSAKFEAYARDATGPRRWLLRREARLLAHEEARLAGRAAATLLVSEAERDLFLSRLGSADRHVVALGNGVDTALFDPSVIGPDETPYAEGGPHIVFTGQMDYPPNVAAVCRMADAIMPLVRARHPHARFDVVGRAPTPAVAARHGVNGTHVWGEVADVRPFLAAADVVAAPLSIARGVQNKVLEAMAMARPVVVTTAAATGIDACDGAEYAVGESDSAFAQAIVELLDNPGAAREMGLSARRFVLDNKSWDAALHPLGAILGARHKQVRDAA